MCEKHYCKDCKYTKGLGYDFWCGEGHSEYEVFLGETDCPYYEFYDWANPSLEEVRFDNIGQSSSYEKKLIKKLNLLQEENDVLKEENKRWRVKQSSFEFLQDENKHMRKVLAENKRLKQELNEGCWKRKYDYMMDNWRELKEYIINADEEELKNMQIALRVVEKMGDDI